jgi:hypothetical protein
MKNVELAEPVEYAVCISTLEHLNTDDQARTLTTIYNALKSGGKFYVTADDIPPEVLSAFLVRAGFSVGAVVPHDDPLTTPKVAWALATKPGGANALLSP